MLPYLRLDFKKVDTMSVLNKEGIVKFKETGIVFNYGGFECIKAVVDVDKEK